MTTEDQTLDAFLISLDSGIITLTFNRPEHGNSLPSTAVLPLVEALKAAQENTAVRCLVIKGKGKHFSAGGDIGAFARGLEMSHDERRADFSKRLKNVQLLVEAVMAFDRPVIAAVKGAVAGAGLLYCLAADMVLAEERAIFVFAHQRVGLSPDAGVSWLLPRIVGLRTAKRLMLTAGRVQTDEALKIGLITQLFAGESDLDEAVAKQAVKFANAPQTATRLAKKLLNQSLSTSLAEQLQAETENIVACVTDADFDEGVRAAVNKRKAIFPSTEN